MHKHKFVLNPYFPISLCTFYIQHTFILTTLLKCKLGIFIQFISFFYITNGSLFLVVLKVNVKTRIQWPGSCQMPVLTHFIWLFCASGNFKCLANGSPRWCDDWKNLKTTTLASLFHTEYHCCVLFL